MKTTAISLFDRWLFLATLSVLVCSLTMACRTMMLEKDNGKATTEPKNETVDQIASKAQTQQPAKAKNAKHTTSRIQTMVVQVDVLNIRSRPSLTAPIVGQLRQNSSMAVYLLGEWAKIGPNKYVMVKFLERTPNPGLAATQSPPKKAVTKMADTK